MIKNNQVKKIHLIIAARPNFIKIAPLYHALLKEKWAKPILVHTGQHYDINMSDVFFKELKLPKPDIYLGVGSGTHAEQTGYVMIAYEKVLLDSKPDIVIVVGDVNSTMAITISSVKLGIKVAHLEAGLRSFDRQMPEEINRVVTDTLSDILWIPSLDAEANLLREGIQKEKIIFVGNIMIDSLEMMKSIIKKDKTYQNLNLNYADYGMITLHRPSNVDNPDVLEKLCKLFIKISKKYNLFFSVHPRTKKNLIKWNLFDILSKEEKIIIKEPLPYVSFMNLLFNCSFVITDSGGIQEETTYLGIPCFTMRPNTERPITITKGTNQLCTHDNLESKILSINTKKNAIKYWDGMTSKRVVESLKQLFFI